jgi:HK97 family phage prohead protease
MASFILSDETPNSYGFIVMTAGISLDRFMMNPVMLHNHREGELIGKWTNLRVEKDQLLADAVFDEDDELALSVKGKVDRGFLKGVSIGFTFDETEWRDNVLYVTKSTLIEASLTPKPSNGSALRIYDSEGQLMSGDQLRSFVELQAGRAGDSLVFKSNSNMKLVATTLGLAATATEEQVCEAVASLKKLAADNAAELEAKNKELKALKDKADADRKLAIEGALTAAKKDNRIMESEVENWRQMLELNFESANSILSKLPPHKPLNQQLNTGVVTPDAVADDKFVGLSFRDLKKTAEGQKYLTKLQAADPEAFEKLRSGK